MLLWLGSWAFNVWTIGGLALILSAPAFWLFFHKLLWLHLALVLCHLYLRFLVAQHTSIPPGVLDHNDYLIPALILEDLGDYPVIFFDLVVLAVRLEAPGLRDVVLGLALLASTFALGLTFFPAWLEAVPVQVIASAHSAAREDPYCVSVGHKPAKTALDLSVDRLISGAFGNSGPWNPHWYYAVLIIEKDGKRSTRNLSFNALRFVPSSPYFQDLHHECEPVVDFFDVPKADGRH